MPGIDWSQVGQAQIFEKGNYLNAGRYKLRLLKTISKQTQQSGVAFIAEFEVLESDNPSHQIGSKATFFVKMLNQQQAFANVLELMAALLGFDIGNQAHVAQIDSQLRPQLANMMVALESQGTAVLGGRETVSVECRKQRTKRGAEFTRHTWAPWAISAGWVPAATPATPAMPQHCEGPAPAPAGYGAPAPAGWGAPPPMAAPGAPPHGAPVPGMAPAAGFQWPPR